MIAEYGKADAATGLIQLVGEYEASGIKREVSEIQKLAGENFKLVAVKGEQWR